MWTCKGEYDGGRKSGGEKICCFDNRRLKDAIGKEGGKVDGTHL